MNEKKAKRIRRIKLEQYRRAVFLWEQSRPPKILFWRYRKWKKNKPVLK